MALDKAYGAINTDDFAKAEDLKPAVEGGIEGINFEQVQSLQPAGASTFHSDHVEDVVSALVLHTFDSERAVDRTIDVPGKEEDASFFSILTDTLDDPSFEFTPPGDARIFNISLRSAGAQTNVMFDITDQMTGRKVWSSKRFVVPMSGIFKIDFTATGIGNVPFDLMNAKTYIFSFSSLDGPVLLLGETATDQPWMEVSFFPFSAETFAYASDLSALDGTFHVDINTTIPLADRDGSIFRPFKTMIEALADAGTPTADNPHSFEVSAGDYAETFILGPFNHIINKSQDAESVKFTSITYDGTGLSSITRCRIEEFIYDTTAQGAGKGSLNLIDCDLEDSEISGRGAGTDIILIDGMRSGSTINARNVLIQFKSVLDREFVGAINFSATTVGAVLLDGQACIVEFDGAMLSGAGASTLTAETTLFPLRVIALNSDLPAFGVVGDFVEVQRDANTVFDLLDISGIATIVNLDKSDQVDYDNTDSGLAAVEVKSAIDEINTIAELYGSSLINGCADSIPMSMSREGPNLYDTTSADFLFIDTTDPQNHVRKVQSYIGETGRVISAPFLGVQRNVFLYLDVSFDPPTVFESFRAPELELNDINSLVSVGNFDLITGVGGDFTEIQPGGVNTFVHTSYAQSALTKMLALTRGSFNITGSVFFAHVDADLKVNITAGRGLRLGVNVQADYQNPDVIDGPDGVINNVNMQWIDTAGGTRTQFQAGKDLDVTNYVPPGADIPELIPNQNQFQIIYLYKFYGSNSIRAHFGEETFISIPLAESVVKDSGPSPRSDQTLEAQLLAALIVRANATNLTTVGEAKFIRLV